MHVSNLGPSDIIGLLNVIQLVIAEIYKPQIS